MLDNFKVGQEFVLSTTGGKSVERYVFRLGMPEALTSDGGYFIKADEDYGHLQSRIRQLETGNKHTQKLLLEAEKNIKLAERADSTSYLKVLEDEIAALKQLNSVSRVREAESLVVEIRAENTNLRAEIDAYGAPDCSISDKIEIETQSHVEIFGLHRYITKLEDKVDALDVELGDEKVKYSAMVDELCGKVSALEGRISAQSMYAKTLLKREASLTTEMDQLKNTNSLLASNFNEPHDCEEAEE